MHASVTENEALRLDGKKKKKKKRVSIWHVNFPELQASNFN